MKLVQVVQVPIMTWPVYKIIRIVEIVNHSEQILTIMLSVPKFKRGSNYTAQEKEELIRITRKYPIIENKQTDLTSSTTKHVAWANITIEYNTLGYPPRTSKHLKHAYDNLKRKTKTTLADNKVSVYKQNHAKEAGGSANPSVELATGSCFEEASAKPVVEFAIPSIEAAKAAYRRDQVELKKTGGGHYVPKLGDEQALVLASIAKEQFLPLQNTFDLDISYHTEENFNYSDIEIEEAAMDNTPQPVAKKEIPKTFKSGMSAVRTKKIENLEKKLDNDARQRYYEFKLEHAKQKGVQEMELLKLNIAIARKKLSSSDVNNLLTFN